MLIRPSHGSFRVARPRQPAARAPLCPRNLGIRGGRVGSRARLNSRARLLIALVNSLSRSRLCLSLSLLPETHSRLSPLSPLSRRHSLSQRRHERCKGEGERRWGASASEWAGEDGSCDLRVQGGAPTAVPKPNKRTAVLTGWCSLSTLPGSRARSCKREKSCEGRGSRLWAWGSVGDVRAFCSPFNSML